MTDSAAVVAGDDCDDNVDFEIHKRVPHNASRDWGETLLNCPKI